MKGFLLAICVLILLITVFVIYKRSTNVNDYIKPQINLEVTSKAFKNGDTIPEKYTGNGLDISPPLQLGEIDPHAKTIAVIMDDIDHPLGVYNHWLIWNIPVRFNNIPEGISKEEVVSSLGDAIQGKSEYGGKHYYRGPNPPFGMKHKYIFKVYVLDAVLDIDKDTDKEKLQKTMDGHILQYGELTGFYK